MAVAWVLRITGYGSIVRRETGLFEPSWKNDCKVGVRIKSIAEKLIRKVDLKLEGKTWPLVVTHKVLIECEEFTSLKLIAGEVCLLRPSSKLVPALLYVALRPASTKYTLEQMGDLTNPGNIVLVQEGLLIRVGRVDARAAQHERPCASGAVRSPLTWLEAWSIA